jgi:tripartite-type tricarboxylate transporter receptor subunit TctC
MKKIFLKSVILVGIFVVFSSLALAQEKFPKEPIRLIITHAAGGSTDIVPRVLQPYLQKAMGVPVVIENMVGAGGNIARGFVYKQKPDGYVLLVSQQPSMSSGEIVSEGKFEVLKLVHVFNVAGRNYDCVAVPYDSPFKTLDEMKKASQTQSLTSAGSGIGTNAYIAAMLLKKSGLNLIYVPFNSGTEAALAVAGGKTQMGTGALDSYYPLHETKNLRVLGVTGPERDESHKELPTLIELGYPLVKMDQMTGVFAPPGLPKDKLDILVKAFQKATSDPEFKAAAAKANLTLQPLPPDEFFKASKAIYDTVKNLEDILKAGVGK